MQHSTRHLVDPQLLPLLDVLPAINLSGETLNDYRQWANEMAAKRAVDSHPSIECSTIIIPGPSGGPDVRLLVYRPTEPAGLRPAIFHVHGGGYVMGSPESNDANNRARAREVDAVVVAVKYRLAPETVFPGAIEDCYAGLLWLWRNAQQLGVDRNRIAVVGESAGGGLAASLALLARDRGEVTLVFQQLIAPMLDDRASVRGDLNPFVGEFVFPQAANKFGWASLLGKEPGGSDVSPYASAARAESLAGLPPAFIEVGALDLFVEEDIDYARRLLHAGVPVELHVTPGAFHGYQMGAAMGARCAIDALESYTAALQRAFMR